MHGLLWVFEDQNQFVIAFRDKTLDNIQKGKCCDDACHHARFMHPSEIEKDPKYV